MLGELLQPEYQLKPSDGRRRNYVVAEHKGAVEKSKEQLKILTDHDSTLFQANGITVNFNVEHIARIQASS